MGRPRQHDVGSGSRGAEMLTGARRSLAALALTAAATLGTMSQASASNLPYDGRDAYSSGCSYHAYVAKSKTDSYYSSQYRMTVSVKAMLWYSPGCRTVWAMVDSTIPDSMWVKLGCNVWRNSDMKHEGCSVRTGEREWRSMMLNDKNLTSFATAWGYMGTDPHEMFASTGSY